MALNAVLARPSRFVWKRLADGSQYGLDLNTQFSVILPATALATRPKHAPLGRGTIDGQPATRRTTPKAKGETIGPDNVRLTAGHGFLPHRNRPRDEGKLLNQFRPWERGKPCLFDDCQNDFRGPPIDPPSPYLGSLNSCSRWQVATR